MESQHDTLSRAVLPIPHRRYAGPVLYDAKDPNAKYAPIRPIRPPADAPNVLIVLIDDVGFGASSAFGGPGSTPTFERLAGDGLKYTPLFADGKQVASGRVEHTEPIAFGRELTAVGRDALSPVTDDYGAGDNSFTGTIKWIEMELADSGGGLVLRVHTRSEDHWALRPTLNEQIKLEFDRCA